MREAAIGLGRLRVREAVAPLLDALARSDADRFLEHAIIFALSASPTARRRAAGLRHESRAVRRAALIALDQMPGGGLTAELVTPHLASDDPALRETALAIATAPPGLGGADRRADPRGAGDAGDEERERDSLRAAVVAFAKAAPVQSLVAEVLTERRGRRRPPGCSAPGGRRRRPEPVAGGLGGAAAARRWRPGRRGRRAGGRRRPRDAAGPFRCGAAAPRPRRRPGRRTSACAPPRVALPRHGDRRRRRLPAAAGRARPRTAPRSPASPPRRRWRRRR